MDHTDNPYSPPQSELADPASIQATEHLKVYSPNQGSLASFLGGPLVGTYFIAMNFKALNESAKARLALVWGLLFSGVLVFGSPFLPERTPKYILPIVYSWAVRLIIEKYQFSKEQISSSTSLSFQSNWKVFGLTLLSLLILLVAIVSVIFAYMAFGFLQDA